MVFIQTVKPGRILLELMITHSLLLVLMGSLSNTLELSNVDLTNQFASMIFSSLCSFQAGSRVVTTLIMILSEAVNLKR